jgi:alginate O-acetyltransferase complex protein AlgI
VVILGFVLFNAADLGQAVSDMAGMFGFGGVPVVTAETLYYLRSYGVVLAAGVVGSTPVIRDLGNRIVKTRVGAVLEPVLLIALLAVCTAYLVDGSFNPFLYFRF